MDQQTARRRVRRAAVDQGRVERTRHGDQRQDAKTGRLVVRHRPAQVTSPCSRHFSNLLHCSKEIGAASRLQCEKKLHISTYCMYAVFAGASPGQKMWGGQAWRAHGARAYNGVRRKPETITVECEIFSSNCCPDLYVNSKMVTVNLTYGSEGRVKLQTMTDPTPSSRVKTHRICINVRNDLWQKWGGHVHPSPPLAVCYRKTLTSVGLA